MGYYFLIAFTMKVPQKHKTMECRVQPTGSFEKSSKTMTTDCTQQTLKTESHYELTLNGRMLSPSYNTDKLKQALTNLSLIYKINFEEVINDRTNDVNSLFSLFKDNRYVVEFEG